MNSYSKLPLACIVASVFGGSASAATVAQFGGWTDGNDGTQFSAEVAFDLISTNSILVVGVYVDAADTSGLSNARFGNGSGVGSGDIAPDASYSDSRSASYLFLNPSTASGLSFSMDSSSGGGLAIILYEVSGASLELGSITAITGSNAIETTTADELIVSFAGRNNTSSATVNGSSIFSDEDLRSQDVGAVRGGGSLASASAVAGSIGSQNITWNSATEGRIAYSFEAVPEPSSLLLLGMGGLLAMRRQRCC